MAIPVLQAARSLLILMADTVLMAEVLFQEKTLQKLTVLLLMQHVILQKTLWQRVFATRLLSRCICYWCCTTCWLICKYIWHCKSER